MNIAQLIRAIAAGDRNSFDTLYRISQRPMLAYAIGLLAGDRGLAEDAVDEAFLNIWTDASGFGGTGSAQGWIRHIVRNKAIDIIRRQKGGRTEQWSDRFEQVAQDSPGPEDLAMQSSNSRWLNAKLQALSLEQREAVFLCYYEELSLSEIAEIMACPEGTVKTRLFHARKALRTQMSDLIQQMPPVNTL